LDREKPILVREQKWLNPKSYLALNANAALFWLLYMLQFSVQEYDLLHDIVNSQLQSITTHLFLYSMPIIFLSWLIISLIYRRGVEIIAYTDRIEIASRGWIYGVRERIIIPTDSIVSITAFPKFKTGHLSDNTGRHDVLHAEVWTEWRPLLNFSSFTIPIVALESKSEKLLIQCRRPEKAAAKMRELYSVPEKANFEIR
jgi:hypothetical protein